MGVPQESRCTVYPCYIASGGASLKLHLWQLGFTSDSYIRGSTTAYNVFKVMEKDMLDGGNTAKHPIEVVQFLGGKVPGQGVKAADNMTSICLWVIQRSYFNGSLSDAEQGHIAAPREGGPERHAHQINSVHERVKDLKIHKTRTELIMEPANQHSSREKVRSSKITTEEIALMNNVLQMSPWFQRRLKIMYQYLNPAHTSAPTKLLSSKLLNAATEPSVKKEERVQPLTISVTPFPARLSARSLVSLLSL